MMVPARFAYTLRSAASGETGHAPLLPLTLEVAGRSASAVGLLDSGASVNVLPYSVGLNLGLDWNAQASIMQLGGNFAATPTRGVVLQATVGNFAPVRLAFAWTQTD